MPATPVEPVVLNAPAKVTLSLRVTGVRPDGYHVIDAEMISVDLTDRLLVTDGDGLVVEGSDGESIPDGGDNLVRRALDLVGRRAHVRLQKRIPPGAGLGGGSSDAAAILRWAGATDLDRAATIGADVPFCVVGGRAQVSGIGEVVRSLPYVEGELTLLTPPFGCPTAAVYRMWDQMGGPRGHGGNDLEPAALAVEPRLGGYRDELAAATGCIPRLAGSGSTWFVEGAFPGEGRTVVRRLPPAGP
jgi:4-diphosphocytidyl-2-C-methyl-D-erythritol kinase